MRATNCSLACALRGPITLITLGALFALNNFTPYRFHQTWPVLLIVMGLLSFAGRGGERRTPSAGSPAPPPPYGGGYRQSPYPNDKAPGGSQ